MKKQEKEAKAKDINDVLPQVEREGELVKFDDVVGKEIIVTGFEERDSQYHDGNYVMIDFIEAGRDQWTTTSSKVIMDQLHLIKENLPVKCTPKKIKKYYTLR